jgi:RecA-family ATPase
MTRRRIEWLLPGRIPFGEITIMAGDPGLGRSLLTVQLVARLTRGELGQARSVLMLTAEDSPEYTVRPRLEAAEASLEGVDFGVVDREGIETPFVFPADVGKLRKLVQERNTGLVVVDPLAAHLAGGINSWKDQEVRTALAPLSALAEETRSAILVVAHLNKGQSEDPLQRLGGSIGIPAAARSVLILARDPDDPDGEQGSRRVLAHVKSNLGSLEPSVRYRIERVALADPSGETVETARMVEEGEAPYTGAELLAAPLAERGAKLREAITFLEADLRSGERPVREVQRAAQELGIKEETLRRAKDELGVKSRRLERGWAWRLPTVTGTGAKQ